DIPPKKPEAEEWGVGDSLASREFDVVKKRATTRAARRTERSEQELADFLASESVDTMLKALFALAEEVRYADDESAYPYIPIATAQLIDTLELFLIRSSQAGMDAAAAGSHLDWAVGVKLVPVFDAGAVNRDKLASLADSLEPPFDGASKHAMREIA